MAVIHHQFETIHPFYDGNGRTGRILNILYLVLSELLDLPILYISRYITTHKADYYHLLQSVRTEHTWEAWILFMLEGIEQTATEIQAFSGKFYSKDLVEALFVHPYTKIEFIEQRLNISRQTASKYLKQLEALGILHSTQLGNSKYFINHRFYELLSRPPK